eukprot:scaffold58322_cov67-Phaeocystis_antarctica.AAC.3
MEGEHKEEASAANLDPLDNIPVDPSKPAAAGSGAELQATAVSAPGESPGSGKLAAADGGAADGGACGSDSGAGIGGAGGNIGGRGSGGGESGIGDEGDVGGGGNAEEENAAVGSAPAASSLVAAAGSGAEVQAAPGYPAGSGVEAPPPAARARKRFENELGKRHIRFDCASTNVKKPGSSEMIKETMEQAWSINSSTAVLNSETLMIVANMLKTYPELHCKLHGSTDAGRGDVDKNKALAAYFKLESTQSIQDELAQKRAKVCKEKLVELGVPGERLLVTWASCGEHSKVDFFPMEPAEAMAEKAVWKAKALRPSTYLKTL